MSWLTEDCEEVPRWCVLVLVVALVLMSIDLLADHFGLGDRDAPPVGLSSAQPAVIIGIVSPSKWVGGRTVVEFGDRRRAKFIGVWGAVGDTVSARPEGADWWMDE